MREGDPTVVRPGDIIDLVAATSSADAERLTTLFKTSQIEVLHIVVPRGSSLPAHRAEGELVIHCLNGQVSVTAMQLRHQLRTGQLLYLDQAARFSIHGLEDASVLMTIAAPKQGANVELIGEHELS